MLCGNFILLAFDDFVSSFFICSPLECVSKREIRKFEQILRQFNEETRRLSSANSRVDEAEMAEKTPKLRIKEFLRHALGIV